MKHIIAILMAFVPLVCSSQTVVKGMVVDSATNEPLIHAAVTYQRNGKTILYAASDTKGRFTFHVKSIENDDRIAASFLGYDKQKAPISSEKDIIIRLSPAAFTLKEVAINGGRITGKPDTVTYDLTRFADKRDNSLKDVLKRLPGVEVDKSGKVSYNGKAISRMTVEGMDLSGGRYGKLNETLKAKDVKNADFIEHDQPVRALQGKLLSDDVAMNIHLKDGSRGKLMATLKPVANIAFPLERARIGGQTDALLIGKRRQSVFNSEYDTTGKDLSASDDPLSVVSTKYPVEGKSMPSWLSIPSLDAPIDADRLRQDRSLNVSVKTISKNKNGSSDRIRARFMHTDEWQSTVNSSTYFLPGNDIQNTDETDDFRIRHDKGYIDYNHNVNKEKSYSDEYLTVEYGRRESFSSLNNSATRNVSQTMKVPELRLSNTFALLQSWGRNSWTLYSTIDFRNAPSALLTDTLSQHINTTQLFTDNYISLLMPHSPIISQYTFGVTAEHLNATHTDNLIAIYATPDWQYRRQGYTFTLKIPMKWAFFTGKGYHYLLLSPKFTANKKVSRHSEMWLYSGFRQSLDGWGMMLIGNYNKDYRTRFVSSGIVPRKNNLYGTLRYEYRRPINELFINASVSFNRLWENTQTALSIDNGIYTYSQRRYNSVNDAYSTEVNASKGFFNLHLKTSLGAAFSYGEGVQISNETAEKCSSKILTLTPKVSFNPSWGEFNYDGAFTISNATMGVISQQSLLSWRQSLSYTATIGALDLTMSAVHYLSEQLSSATSTALIANASAVLRLKKVRIEAEMRNIFDNRRYVVASYGSIFSSTTAYNLRQREAIISVQIVL